MGQSETGSTTVSVHDISVKTSSDNHIKECETSMSTKTCTTQSRHEPVVCSVIPII